MRGKSPQLASASKAPPSVRGTLHAHFRPQAAPPSAAPPPPRPHPPPPPMPPPDPASSPLADDLVEGLANNAERAPLLEPPDSDDDDDDDDKRGPLGLVDAPTAESPPGASVSSKSAVVVIAGIAQAVDKVVHAPDFKYTELVALQDVWRKKDPARFKVIACHLVKGGLGEAITAELHARDYELGSLTAGRAQLEIAEQQLAAGRFPDGFKINADPGSTAMRRVDILGTSRSGKEVRREVKTCHSLRTPGAPIHAVIDALKRDVLPLDLVLIDYTEQRAAMVSFEDWRDVADNASNRIWLEGDDFEHLMFKLTANGGVVCEFGFFNDEEEYAELVEVVALAWHPSPEYKYKLYCQPIESYAYEVILAEDYDVELTGVHTSPFDGRTKDALKLRVEFKSGQAQFCTSRDEISVHWTRIEKSDFDVLVVSVRACDTLIAYYDFDLKHLCADGSILIRGRDCDQFLLDFAGKSGGARYDVLHQIREQLGDPGAAKLFSDEVNERIRSAVRENTRAEELARSHAAIAVPTPEERARRLKRAAEYQGGPYAQGFTDKLAREVASRPGIRGEQANQVALEHAAAAVLVQRREVLAERKKDYRERIAAGHVPIARGPSAVTRDRVAKCRVCGSSETSAHWFEKGTLCSKCYQRNRKANRAAGRAAP